MHLGGMQACGFTLEEVQNEGLSIASSEISILKKRLFALRNMNAGLQGSIKSKHVKFAVELYLPVNAAQSSTYAGDTLQFGAANCIDGVCDVNTLQML